MRLEHDGKMAIAMRTFCVISPQPAKPSLGLLLLGFIFISGCASTARPLIPTPAIYQTLPGGRALFAETPAARRTGKLELLYVTDRAPETSAQSELPYGEKRSRSLIFGSAVVSMGPNLQWAELERQSRLAPRTKTVNLELTVVRERGRFPEEPYALEVTASQGVVRSPAVAAQHRQLRARFQMEIRQQLQQAPSKEVVLYVHGLGETFASAAYTLADLCHYLGREHVCVVFTWPASASGNLPGARPPTTASVTDAVDHLRKTVRMIAQTAGVKGVHLLAHQQGAAVLLSAVRELGIETVAAGVEPADALKLNNVVLMAPDGGQDVGAHQLEIANSDPDMISLWPYARLPSMVRGRMSIYLSPTQRTAFLSRATLRGREPNGPLSPESLTAALKTRMGRLGRVDYIVYQAKRPHLFASPSHLLNDPTVSSDLIQLIRYNKRPGEPGRPLKKLGPVLWSLAEGEAS